MRKLVQLLVSLSTVCFSFEVDHGHMPSASFSIVAALFECELKKDFENATETVFTD